MSAEPARAFEDPAPSPWWLAVRAGAGAFLWVALAALTIGALEWLAAGRPYGLRLPWKLAGLYIGSVNGAGVRVLSGLPGGGGAVDVASLVPATSTLHVTFLLGSAFAFGIAWRAGRRVAGLSGGGRIRSLLWGASVAMPYSLLVTVVALVVVLRFPTAGVSELKVIGWQAAAGALVVAGVAGASGGASAWRSPPPGVWAARILAWVHGGWQMTIALLVLAFVGFLVTAGVRPDVSAAYVRGVSGGGAAGAILAGHHVLLAPNQSFLIALPAMGGCVVLDGSSSQATELCLRSFTIRSGWGELLFDAAAGTVRLSPVWLLFLAVPGAATVWGGWGAGAGAGSTGERAFRGAGAGVVFAALVVVGEAVAAVSVSRPSGEAVVRLGADLARTGIIACAWGLVGGAMGAVSSGRRQEPDGVGLGEPEPEPEPAPPSPTSE